MALSNSISAPKDGDSSLSCLDVTCFSASFLSHCVGVSDIWSEHAKLQLVTVALVMLFATVEKSLTPLFLSPLRRDGR